MTVRQAAHALHAESTGQDVSFTAVSTDSRTVAAGNLFVALTGEKFDGHDYLAEVKQKGASAALVRRDSAAKIRGMGIPLILVEDPRLALGQLAKHWRDRFAIPVVAVTGSNGKTTVKEMLASILLRAAQHGDRTHCPERVLFTEGNLNNDIGVPLTLLRMRAQHVYAVIEMGMNHFGEIAYLSRLAKPGVAVITNAGMAHTRDLGSVEAVANAKGEIFEGLDEQGIAVINADDPYAPLWRKLAGMGKGTRDGKARKILDFGLDGKPAVSARYQLDPLDTRHSSLDSPGSKISLLLPTSMEEVQLQVPGVHNIYNALAAATAAVAMGIEGKIIAAGLSQFRGVKGRMQRKHGLHGSILIDDSYNANPESVKAGLAVLAKATGKKIVVLGDMGELGDGARDAHARIGAEARFSGVDKLFALGELSVYAVDQFGPGAKHFGEIEGLLAEVESELTPDTTVLIKGSRFMRMERVAARFER
ncbi:MAG TPA: UDP-N-acetylmuramoyl-tripeptide--D-alanyl-D-alanine ligase [Nitrosospira sp.]|nr:UDP-N-acetylmuramoyl-tripeptide--D-alanyl-D-alanine ligase [Nitrosospira sp.]